MIAPRRHQNRQILKEKPNKMKKLMTLMLGMALVFGATSAFAQEKKEETKKEGKKGGGKKKGEETKKEGEKK
jgi:cell division protein FtsB